MKLKVNKNGELLDYLYNNLDMPKKKIKQYLTHGAIFVNNVKIRQYNYPIINGMEIVINTDSKNKKVLPFEVLFEDDNIIVVNKPAGLLTIATAKEKEKTLYHIVSDYLKSKDRNARVFIVHRLDKETSGVLVLAKNEKIKKQLQENWNEYVSLREYVAVVHGHLKEQEKKIIQNLKETKTNLVYVTKHNDGKEAITNYKVIKESSKYSLVSINIETGRKNQIRVAFSSLGNPIVGDNKYGIRDKENRLYLHANRLKMYYPVIKKDILFETSNPVEFRKIMDK
ncbi:MAG: RluA family pseudouridine synthase [Tenericutes bacterium]|nr:RluA family pseudouridine synthase [Mycoplasmatota bacterium]